MAEATPSGFDAVQHQFSLLWRALLNDGDLQRPPEDRRLLVDQVKDALDRGETRLSKKPTRLVANTFALEDRIHDGTATEVHRARHRDLGTYHAIKTLKPGYAGDPLARRMLLDEAKIGLTLRHRNIVATQAMLRLADGRPALVFEWCGRSLSEHLRQGPISIADIRTVVADVLSGLAVVHDAGFIHCDLSPSNLLFAGDPPAGIRLADFGIALEVGQRHADLDLSFAGQPEFAAPEQRAGKPLDQRCDLFAAGRLLELLLDHCNEETSASPLGALAAHLFQPEREDRPESARAAAVLLEATCPFAACLNPGAAQLVPGSGAAAEGALFW